MMRVLNRFRALRRLCTTPATSAGADSATTAANGEAARLANEGIRGFLDTGTSAGATKTGRAWRTAELRLKSFDDLHRLWFVLLRERNTLLTEKSWCKTNGRHWVGGQSNLVKVKRSMARVQGVVGERARAYKAQQQRLVEDAESKGLVDAVRPPKTSYAGVVARP
jgi:large subunit ribosomal protein L47